MVRTSLRLSAPGAPHRPVALHALVTAAAAPALIALVALVALIVAAAPAAAQLASITVPPSGGNQRATTTQGIGLVKVTIDYSSPHVHSPAGEDRRGKIWGGLVPYGMANLGFGTCGDQCPWRGGANENTLFVTTHDIKVQGQVLPAGSYGVHFIPGKEEWTVIFSKNSTSWGSFFYDKKEDALRVTAKPAKSDYHEDLTYWFRDRKLDHATAVLSWEDLELPLDITVENAKDLYAENMERELRSSAGFTWMGWNTAANYCLTNKTHLDEGLRWAERAIDVNQGGQANFTTLSTMADLQEANNQVAEGKKTRTRALHDPPAPSTSTSTPASCWPRRRPPRRWKSSSSTTSSIPRPGPSSSASPAATPPSARRRRRSSTPSWPCRRRRTRPTRRTFRTSSRSCSRARTSEESVQARKRPGQASPGPGQGWSIRSAAQRPRMLRMTTVGLPQGAFGSSS